MFSALFAARQYRVLVEDFDGFYYTQLVNHVRVVTFLERNIVPFSSINTNNSKKICYLYGLFFDALLLKNFLNTR